MLRALYDWTVRLAESPRASWALAAVSFAESSFFPVPPDVMLAPMALARPERAYRYALICTIASVLGGILGYAIGSLLFDSVGLWMLNLYGLGQKIDDVRSSYAQYGAYLILIKGLTPIPFKVVTIVSGAMSYPLAAFIALSVITRGARFFLVAVMMRHASVLRQRLPLAAAAFVLAAGLFAIGGAWFIQLVLGVLPCPLCLEQRWPYYLGLPVALIVLAIEIQRGPPRLVAAGLALVALIFAVGTGLGVYHAGVEWQFWAGPSDCTGPISAPVGVQDFMKQLETVKVVRCDAVAMRIFGLSLAAWNAILSGTMTLVAGSGAVAALRSAKPGDQGSSSVSQ
jgi:membrane protein YqaA with SNARE-associated domain/disulfide bond formation protein DsbB